MVNAVMVQYPKYYGEAINRVHREQWQVVMTEELDALKLNDVWTVVVPPEVAHVLHNKWVYRRRPTRTGISSGTRLAWSSAGTNKCSE